MFWWLKSAGSTTPNETRWDAQTATIQQPSNQETMTATPVVSTQPVRVNLTPLFLKKA
ncbi:hypothetical protein ABHI18_008068 [Aspergillus niger]